VVDLVVTKLGLFDKPFQLRVVSLLEGGADARRPRSLLLDRRLAHRDGERNSATTRCPHGQPPFEGPILWPVVLWSDLIPIRALSQMGTKVVYYIYYFLSSKSRTG